MSVEMESNNCFSEIAIDISRLPKLADEAEKKALKEIGKVLKSNTKKILDGHRSTEDNMINYDGSRPYVHLADDIKTSVRSDRLGVMSLVVHGGKKTAFKWHLVDDGAAYPSGEISRGLNFTSKAMKESQAAVDAIIDRIIEEVADGIGN